MKLSVESPQAEPDQRPDTTGLTRGARGGRGCSVRGNAPVAVSARGESAEERAVL